MNKPIHAKPSLYAFYFEAMKEIALKYGYNLVLHGSMNRDLDLIAIPWQDEIKPYTEMVKDMCELIGGALHEGGDQTIKPHGRKVMVININRTISYRFNGLVAEQLEYDDPQYYIDISIMT